MWQGNRSGLSRLLSGITAAKNADAVAVTNTREFGATVTSINVALSGQLETVSQGTVTPSAATNVQLSSQQESFSQQTLFANIGLALTGQFETDALGNVTPDNATTIALTGQAAAYSQSGLTPNLSLGLSGQLETDNQGAVTPSSAINVQLAGQSESFSQSGFGVNFSLALSGQNETGLTGTVTPSNAVNVVLTGQFQAFTQGALVPDFNLPLAGQSETDVAGIVTPNNATLVALTGQVETLSQTSWGGGQPLKPPANFRWQNPPLNIFRAGNTFSTDFDITTLIPTVTNTWYVDPVSGNNATALVNSRANPLKDLATALAKVDVDQIRIINLIADHVGRVAQSWNNVQPSRSVSVIVENGFRYISAKAGSSIPPTWAVNGIFGNVYQSAFTAVNSNQVVDFSNISFPSYVNDFGVTVTLSSSPPIYQNLKKVASIAAVSAEAGTWFNDGVNTYVRSYNDRNLVGDNFMQPTPTATNNGRFTNSLNNLTIYIDGIDFVGGTPFFALVPSTVTGCRFIHRNCSFQSSGNNANGLSIAGNLLVIGQNSGAYKNWADGFNYHSFESDGLTPGTSPNVIEIGCSSQGNGTTGSVATSDNGTTTHDYVNIIRLNSAYSHSNDRVLADINFAQSWNIGCVVGPSDTLQSVQIGNSAKGWFDTATLLNAPQKWAATETGTIFHYHSGAMSNIGGATGTITAYMPFDVSAAPIIDIVTLAGLLETDVTGTISPISGGDLPPILQDILTGGGGGGLRRPAPKVLTAKGRKNDHKWQKTPNLVTLDDTDEDLMVLLTVMYCYKNKRV